MKAWELLSKPGAWTQGFFARDSSGSLRHSCEPDACCWCAIGAISLCYKDCSPREDAIQKLFGRVGNVAEWNDYPLRTQDEVVAVLKELDI